MTNSTDMRELINLVESVYAHLEPTQQEQKITQSKVIKLEVSPYDLTRIVREYRSGTNSYGDIQDNAMLSFYSPEEQEDFEKYLNSKGIKFSRITDT